ncbi:MAG: orotate phosphoribosyltransferase [Gammaproteobacteria bacterium]|nr:orotate phosphoribosyltransferase [Gammaproteobacteria bacterium]
MRAYQTIFIELALEYGVLRFGEFRLKSGRVSPYFFNLGAISTGVGLRRLAQAYAEAIEQTMPAFEVLFGPAYKGIPLAAAVVLQLAAHGRDLGFAYDRKEVKDHGEGGALVGAPLRGRRVLLIDDVLTAGTALRASLQRLRDAGAEPVAALVALDRQERGDGTASARAELAGQTGLEIGALVGVGDILEYLTANSGAVPAPALAAIRDYQRRYGAGA